jgi:hypothetical protein
LAPKEDPPYTSRYKDMKAKALIESPEETVETK